MKRMLVGCAAVLIPWFVLVAVEHDRPVLPPKVVRQSSAVAVPSPELSRAAVPVRVTASPVSRSVERVVLGPSEADLYRLRVCESSDDYAANTGNGYFGAYQFDLSTWESNGGVGRPDLAPPAEQDRMTRLLHSRRGWQPWPACAKRFGWIR